MRWFQNFHISDAGHSRPVELTPWLDCADVQTRLFLTLCIFESIFLLFDASLAAITLKNKMQRNVRERTFGHVRPAKIQISLRIRAGWSESSLGAF